MTTVACTLVSLCVCLTLAWSLPVPAAKRLPLSTDHGDDVGEDVLAGSDFLSVFMGRSARGPLRPAARLPSDPFEPHHYDRDLNSVTNHKGGLLDLVKPYPPQYTDKYTITNIFRTNKYGYVEDDYQETTPEVKPTVESEVKTTTSEDVPTTGDYSSTRNTTEGVQQTTTQEEEDTTTTTQQDVTEKFEEKVISVRVSSSVARHSHRIETSTAKSTTRVVSRPLAVDENLVTTLVTQEQPTITAVQRSDFAVEEAPLPNPKASDHQESKEGYERHEEVEGKVEEVSLYGGQQPRSANGKLPVFEIHFHNPPAALISNYGERPEVMRREEPAPYRKKEFRQLSLYGTGRPESISYQTRVSSATSDSNVKYYREHPRANQAAAETVNQPVLVEPNQRERETSTFHEEPQEQTYGEPEKVYGRPEENYEVDEAVSVITNGKAHGVQAPTPPPGQNPDDPAQNKFGYVVEGRNFRKYRVEERTADGFIVGEYGVVSHDDGSLRGVRYTADSTINPRLIYDTLVKFLSLK